jgi:hypothetical protein
MSLETRLRKPEKRTVPVPCAVCEGRSVVFEHHTVQPDNNSLIAWRSSPAIPPTGGRAPSLAPSGAPDKPHLAPTQ